MKAEIVFNTCGKPRLLLSEFTAWERERIKDCERLELIRVGETDGVLTDLAYNLWGTLVGEDDEELIYKELDFGE